MSLLFRFEIQQKLKAAKKKEKEKKKKSDREAPSKSSSKDVDPIRQDRRSKVEANKKGTDKFSALADLKAKREEKRRLGWELKFYQC